MLQLQEPSLPLDALGLARGIHLTKPLAGKIVVIRPLETVREDTARQALTSSQSPFETGILLIQLDLRRS